MKLKNIVSNQTVYILISIHAINFIISFTAHNSSVWNFNGIIEYSANYKFLSDALTGTSV